MCLRWPPTPAPSPQHPALSAHPHRAAPLLVTLDLLLDRVLHLSLLKLHSAQAGAGRRTPGGG